MGARLLAAAAALALAGCGGADQANRATAEGEAPGKAAAPANAAAAVPLTAATGRQYVELVRASDLFEIESARLAEQMARRPEVREFARMLAADHRRSTAELNRAVAQARPPIHVAPALNPAQQAELQALRAAGGATFDPVWIRQQVNAHEWALTMLTAYVGSGDVEPLRRHAENFVGSVQQHLARARELEVPAPREK